MSNKRRRKKKVRKHLFRNIIIALISIGFISAGAMLLWAANLKIPDFTSFEERKVAQSTKIYDKTGEVLLYDVHKDIKRTIVPFSEISRNVKNATVAIEDAEFYEHKGVKPTAIIRAVLYNTLQGKLLSGQGGSTITQQVIKNTLLTSEKKVSRKFKEWALALKIETAMSKEEILTIYLNEAPYGGNIYGVEEASMSFFGKKSSSLTIAESAYLAALPQAPTFFSPYGKNKSALDNRKDLVLSQMLDLGFISGREYIDAQKEIVVFKPREDGGIKAPHFVFYIISYIEEKYGRDAIEKGGLKITTTLDYDLQKKAEDILKEYALENAEKFNATNAGLIATDPKTGQILTMVGSRDYFDEEIDGNFNITTSYRQPGSAFKPFVYATAFKKGYTPDTVVFDLPTQFQTTCDPEGNPLSSAVSKDECYMPVNYDGKYAGPISLRDALAQSVNVPAIKALYLSGLQDSLQTAKDFGIKSLTNIGQYGLTLVLGGGEVSLLDITNAYGVFANDGVKNDYTGILLVEDSEGNIIEQFSRRPERIVSEQVARQISDVLSDNDARAPAFGQRSFLYFNEMDVAAKTGTTNDYRDAWIVGYTPTIAVGTWAGNNDNSPMNKKVAGFIVAPMWNAFMKEALRLVNKEDFIKPDKTPRNIKPVLRGVWQGGETYTIDTISGKLATQYTPEETREERNIESVHSILYWVNKKDPLGDIPEKPQLDPQFNLWEFPVLKWAKEKQLIDQATSTIPVEFDDIHTPESMPTISIVDPKNNVVYDKNTNINIATSWTGKYPQKRLDVFVNNNFIGSTTKAPFTFSFTPSNITGLDIQNTVKVVGYDTVFNKTESSTIFITR